MKWAMLAAAVIGAACLISCGEDDRQQIIDNVNAHLDQIGIVANYYDPTSTETVISFDFKTADTAENRALLKVLAPNIPTDGRLIVRIKDDLASEEVPPVELGNMKLSVTSDTSVAMNVQFISAVTIDENEIPIDFVQKETVTETFAIKYPLTDGGLDINGVWYYAEQK